MTEAIAIYLATTLVAAFVIGFFTSEDDGGPVLLVSSVLWPLVIATVAGFACKTIIKLMLGRE